MTSNCTILLFCNFLINFALAVQVSTFTELQQAIEVNQDTEIIIDVASINLEHPLEFSSGLDVTIQGVIQDDGTTPIIFGAVSQQPTSHFIVSTTTTQVTMSNLSLAPSQESVAPTMIVPRTQFFAIRDNAQLVSNNIRIHGGLCRGWLLTSDGFCVSGLTTTTTSWNLAESDCLSRNYHLPSVHSEKTLDQLFNLVETTVNERMWIGGRVDVQGKPLEWSDGSNAQDFPWPLSSLHESSNSGPCVYIDGEAAGLWNSTSCDTTQAAELPYACAFSLGNTTSVLDEVLGTTQGVQHTQLTIEVSNFEEFAATFSAAAAMPPSSFTAITVAYVDSSGEVRNATMHQQTNLLIVQVKLLGTSLPSTLTSLVDTSTSASPIAGTLQGQSMVFDITVSAIPHLLQVITDPNDSIPISISTVQLLLNGSVVFESTLETDCVNIDSILEGTFTPYFVSGSEIGVPNGQHFSQDFTESGCNTMSLWTHPSRPSPLELRVEGTHLPNLIVSVSSTGTGSQLASETGWMKLQIPSNGVLPLPMTKLTASMLIPASFRVDAIGSGCLGALALRYYGDQVETLNSFAADITIEECPGLCGNVYDTTNQCVKMEPSHSQQLSTITLDLLTTEGTCAVLEQAGNAADRSNFELCTFQGNFTQENFDSVFDDSSEVSYSMFAFTFLPASIPPSSEPLPKNRVLQLDGLQLNVEDAPSENTVTVPRFQVLGSIEFDSVILLDGITVSGNGQAALGNSNIKGRITLQDAAKLTIQSSILQLGSESPVLMQDQSSIEISGVQVPQELNQASAILETTSTGSVTISSMAIEDPTVDIGQALNIAKLPTGEVQYEYTVCSSEDPNAVPLNSLTLLPGITDQVECQQACDKTSCSGFGLDVDESTNEFTCHLCLEAECIIECEDVDGAKSTGIYMAATNQEGFVEYSGCFAATVQPDPIKVVPSLSDSVTVRKAKCNAVCDLYQDCGATRIQGTDCLLYPQIALASEDCAPPLLYSIRFPLEVSEFASVPIDQVKTASPRAKFVVGSRTLDECTVLCSHHQACDLFQHDESQNGLCTFLSTDDNKSAPWITSGLPSGSGDVYVQIGPEFPRVVYEEWHAENNLVVNPEDALETVRLDEDDCATECSTIANCVAFQFAQLNSVSSDTDNCLLHTLEGMRSILRAERTGSSPFKLMVATMSEDFLPVVGNTNVTLGFGVQMDDITLKFDNVFSFDTCKALCFIHQDCDLVEYNVVTYTCVVVPFKEQNDAFAVIRENFNITNPNVSLLQLGRESPFDNDVVYTRVEGECLDTVPVDGSTELDATLDACKAFCNVHPDCQVFIFTETEACALYESISVPEDDTICSAGPQVFYVASHNPDAESYFRIPFDSCFVKQLGDAGVISVSEADGTQQCEQACKAESTCRAYSFDQENGCILRDDSSLALDDCTNPVESYLESFSQYFTQANLTSPGSVELFTVDDAQVTLVQCESLCVVFEKCVAIAVSSAVIEEVGIGGKCVLLTTASDGETGADTYEKDGDILRVLDSYNPYLFTPVSNLRVAPSQSKVLTTVPAFVAVTQNMCEALCESVEACNSITYHMETRECTFFEANSWTQDEYVDEIRSPKLHYSVGFQRFVNQLPEFARFTARGEYFASTEPFETLSNVPTATACKRACLEAEQQCGLAHFAKITKSCSLFPEETKISNAGKSKSKICEEVQLVGTQELDLAEIILLDAHGSAMYDSEVIMNLNGVENSQEAVDGLANTVFAATDDSANNLWVGTFCAPKPIHKVKVRYDYGGGRVPTRYGLYIRETRPEYNIPLYDTSGFEALKFREVGTLKHVLEPTDEVIDLPFDRILQPDNYVLRENACVGSNGHISTLRPRLPVECAEHCDIMPRCVAFNYDKSTGTCYFTNDIIDVPLDNCGNLDAYIDMNSIPSSVPPQRCCSVFRVEMDSTTGRELDLCEIEFLDAAGNAMVDTQAGVRATSSEGVGSSGACSPGSPECAFDGNTGSNPNTDGCFVGTTEPIAFLETTVCTPQPVDSIRITSRGENVLLSRSVRNAKVYFTSSLIANSEGPRAIGVIEYFDEVNSVVTINTHGYCGLPAPGLGAPAEITNTVQALALPPYGCQRVIIESAPNSHLHLCEVEVYDEDGQHMFDSKAASRASASSMKDSDEFCDPRFAADGNDATDITRYGCFESEPGKPAFWETTFCPRKPIASIRVVGATNEDGPIGVLNGATVTIMQSTGKRDVVGTLSNFNILGQPSNVIEVIPGSVNPTTTSSRGDGLYCGTVMVDLEASEAGTRLELCNVEVLDRDGNVMFDSNARSTARAHSVAANSGFAARLAVDSNTSLDGSQRNNCYRSKLLQGEVRRISGIDHRIYGWWKAEFCTPRPIEAVRIQRRTDSESRMSLSLGSSVYFGNFNSDMRLIGRLISERTTVLQTSMHCTEAFVTQDSGHLTIREVEVISSIGADPDTQKLATATRTESVTAFSPKRAVDVDTSTFYRNPTNTAPDEKTTWKSSFCSSKLPRALRVQTGEGLTSDSRVLAKINTHAPRRLGMVDNANTGVFQIARHCTKVTVELDAENNRFMQLFGVRVRKAEGFEVLDFNAAARSTSNPPPHSSISFVAPEPTSNGVQHPIVGRFISENLPDGEIGTWSTVYCLAEKLAFVEVEFTNIPFHTEFNMNGARVYVTDSTDQIQRLIGEIQGDSPTNSKIHKFPVVSELCPTIRFEKSPRLGSASPLQVCLSSQGGSPELLHYRGEDLAISSGGNDPTNAVVSNSQCFESNPVAPGETAYWQGSFCTDFERSKLLVNADRSVPVPPSYGTKLKILKNNKFVHFATYDFKDGDLNWKTELPPNFDLPTGCTNVRIELEGGFEKVLQFSEVQVLDSEGRVMVDPGAAGRVTATETPGNGQQQFRLPTRAVDGEIQTSTASFIGYRSKNLPSGEVGFWQTTFCVPRTVAMVEIHCRIGETRMDGAQVFINHDADPFRPFGPFPGLPTLRKFRNFVNEEGGHIWRHVVEYGQPKKDALSLPPDSCIDVRIQFPESSTVNLCEIELRDSSGRVMLDSAAGARSPIYQEDKSAFLVADGDPGVGASRCAVIVSNNGFSHRIRFCTPRRVATINLFMNSPKEVADKVELHVTSRRGAVGREQQATRVGDFNEVTMSQHFTLSSCNTVRVELPGNKVTPSTDELQLCTAKAMDEEGNDIGGAFAISSTTSSTRPFGGSCTKMIGWWEGTFCSDRKLQTLQVYGRRDKREFDIDEARVFLYSDQVGKALELGRGGITRNRQHAGLHHVSDLTELTSFRKSRFGSCSTISIDLDEGVTPLGLCKVRVFDSAGAEMLDRTAVLSAKSFPPAKNARGAVLPVYHHLSLQPTGVGGCFETLQSEGHRHWEATMCLPRPIATMSVVGFRERVPGGTQVMGKVKVITRSVAAPEAYVFESTSVQHFGDLVAQPSDGNNPEFRLHPQIAPVADYPSYDDNEILGSIPAASGSSCVDVEIVTLMNNTNELNVCELNLLDTRGELIPRPPSERITIKTSGGVAATGAKLEKAIDGLQNSCYRSFVRSGRIAVEARICGIDRPIGGVRVEAGTGKHGFPEGTRVYLTTNDGTRIMIGAVSEETKETLDLMIDSVGENHFGEYLMPYDNADFGEVAEDAIDVGKSMNSVLRFSFQTKESCAALCSEWFQCAGFFLQSRTCSLRPGLAVTDFIDGTTFPALLAPTPPGTSPTSTPTEAPTSLLSKIQNFERTLGPFAALDVDQGLCLPALGTTETAFVEGIELEACSTFCNVMPECRALKWNLKGCQVYTARTGFDIVPCAVGDIGSVQLISLQRLLENENAFRMQNIGNRYPRSSTTGFISEGGETTAEECANTCLQSDSCSLSEFFTANGVFVCKIHESVTGSAIGTDALQFAELTNDPRTLSQSSLKVRKSNYQVLKGRKVVNASLVHTLRNIPFLGCMALCDISRKCDGFNFNHNSHECSLVAGIPTKKDEVVLQSITGTDFYRSSFVHRRSQFGGPEDFVRLANNVDRTECEGACRLLGLGCQAIVHTLTGECRLTRFAQTQPGVLRNNLGFCLVKDEDGIIRPSQDSPDCLEVAFQYVFKDELAQSSLGRIRLVSKPNTCLARRLELEGTTVVRKEGLKELNCDNIDQGGTDLSWTTDATVVNTLASNVAEAEVVIHLCSDGVDVGIRCPEETWGLATKEHSSDRFVDVYVDAEALEQSQVISNPNFLFFQWLYSSEGKTARSLHAKMRQFAAVVKTIQSSITRGVLVATGAFAIVSKVQIPIDMVDATISPIIFLTEIFVLIARFGELIPYVKFVAKPIRLVLDFARKMISRGFGKVVKAVGRTDKLLDPLNAFEDRLIQASTVFAAASTMVKFASTSMLSLAFCASTSELQARIALMDRKMKEAIRAADNFMSLGREIPKATKAIGTVKNLFNKFVFNPAKQIVRAFRPVSKVVKAFGWLRTVFTTQVCFKLPIVGRVCLPSLEDIGNFVSRIVRMIRKIPFTGRIVGLVEKTIGSVLETIFKLLGIPLPTFPIDFSFTDKLFDVLSVDLNAVVGRIGKMTDLGEILPLSFDVEDVFDVNLLPDLDFLGIDVDPNLGLQIPGVDLPSVDDVANLFAALFDETSELGRLLEILFTQKPICTKPAPAMRCQDIFRELGPVGDALQAELGASDCPFPVIPSCGKWELPSLGAIQDDLDEMGERIVQKVFGGDSESSRRLRQLSTSDSFSFEITLLGKEGILNKIVPEAQEKFGSFVNSQVSVKSGIAKFNSVSFSLDVEPAFLSLIIGKDKGKFRMTFEVIMQQVKVAVSVHKLNVDAKRFDERDIVRIRDMVQYLTTLQEWQNQMENIKSVVDTMLQNDVTREQEIVSRLNKLKQHLTSVSTKFEDFIKETVSSGNVADIERSFLSSELRQKARRFELRRLQEEPKLKHDIKLGATLDTEIRKSISNAFVSGEEDQRKLVLRIYSLVVGNIFDSTRFKVDGNSVESELPPIMDALLTKLKAFFFAKNDGQTPEFVKQFDLDIFRAVLDFKFNPQVFGNLIGGVTNLEFTSTSFSTHNMKVFEAQNFISLVDPWNYIASVVDNGGILGAVAYGPIQPFANLLGLFDNLSLLKQRKERNAEDTILETKVSVALNLPFGFTLTVKGENSCSILGLECFDAFICPVAGFVPSVQTGRSDGSSCTCGEQCESGNCSVNGVLQDGVCLSNNGTDETASLNGPVEGVSEVSIVVALGTAGVLGASGTLFLSRKRIMNRIEQWKQGEGGIGRSNTALINAIGLQGLEDDTVVAESL